jgi:hypothetical protein
MEWIYKKIWELKSKALTLENKERIQRLQQLLDNPTESQKENDSTTSEKVSNNNSANSNSSNEEKEIHRFLFNRYNR